MSWAALRVQPPLRLLPVALAVVGLAALLGALAVYTAPATYTSTAVVSLQPRETDPPPAAAMISLLATPYVAYAASDEVVQELAAETSSSAEEVDGGLQVRVPPRSTNVEIRSAMASPDDAVAVAEALSERLTALSISDETLVASTTLPPGRPTGPDNSALRLVALAALSTIGVLALSLAAGLVTRARRGTL